MPLNSTYGGSYGSDHSEAALRQLHRATKTQRNGEHLLSLAALRTLRDPDLRPFFHQFSQHPDWAVQVHAVLGIAELSDDNTVDPWLIQQIAPMARERVIAQALDDGLFQKEQIEVLLNWPLLETSPRLLLLADLQRISQFTNIEMLKKLANNTDLSVAMFAALLSGDEKSIENTTQGLRRATNADRSRSLQNTFRLIRQYQWSDANLWLLSLLEQNAVALTDLERYWALFTLLTIDRVHGLESWHRAFSTDPERREQVKFLLLLLESGVTPTTQQIERLQIDLKDPLLGLMVRAGNVNADAASVTPEDAKALAELVERGHRASTDWAFRVVEDRIPSSLAKLFYESLSTIPQSSNSRRNAVAVKAFVRLIILSPETAWDILRNAKDDSDQQQLLLLGVFRM